MGIFADKCQALIDPATKEALTGEALTAVQQDPQAERCGNKVRKAAKRCSQCGAPAPGGWRKCPGCNKWVGNESQFCWNCATELHPGDRVTLSDGVWRKPVGVLARVVDVGDVKELLHKGKIFVQEGTSALLLQGGKFKDTLTAGDHSLDSLGHKINHWGDPPPRTVVLVDSGDIAIPVRVEDLRSSEDIPLELYTELHIRIAQNDKQAKALCSNVLKESRELTYGQFSDLLISEIVYAAGNICTQGTVEDLVKDPERRLRIEDEIGARVKQSAERYGFELIRVSSAEFTGAEYETLRQKSGETEIARRNAEFDQRLREIEQKDRMGEFKTQQDLQEYIDQLQHERDITDEHREQELKKLDLLHKWELHDFEQGKALDADSRVKEHGRTQDVKDTESEIQQQDIKFEQEKKETEYWENVRADKDARKLKNKAELAKILDGVKFETMLALIDDPTQRDSLLELNRQNQQQGRSAMEILAMSAERSPDAARALASVAGVDKEELERVMDERRKLYEETRAHDERTFDKAADTAAEAARNSNSTSNIISQ